LGYRCCLFLTLHISLIYFRIFWIIPLHIIGSSDSKVEMGIQPCAQSWGIRNLTNQSFMSFGPKFQKHLEDLGLISASTQVAYTMKEQQSLHPELGYYKYYYLWNDTGLPVLFNVYFF
jgi:hypothetical protein